VTFRRKQVHFKELRRRFAVTLSDNEGVFSGVMTDFDDATMVFEDCKTDKEQPIAGRVFVDRIQIAYIQELGG
jgi:hypothetical protein